MDGIALGFFLFAAFLGGMVSGLAGFAMGLVVSAIWLHILTPIQTATLTVGYALVTQGYSIWRMWSALSWPRLAPFIVGAVVGVPIGTLLLTLALDPAHLRPVFGVLLMLYSFYSLARPAVKPVLCGAPADIGIGVANGVMGGMTGLSGIIVTIWCQVRGWPKDVQRTVFQPVSLATIMLSAVTLSAAGAVTTEVVKLYLLGLPFMLAGLWLGFKLYGKLDEALFRKVILVLLLIAGVTLIVPTSAY
jgi:uncharacterized protein